MHSKVDNQKTKNKTNQNENDLKIQQYEKIIELKKQFLQFSDERKEIQNQIAQQAKNDSQDKQEVEKRKTLKLLMLYNQYLRALMDEELKKNADLEASYCEIRNICGTQDLEKIVEFIVLRDKRYNLECKEINDREKKKLALKEEIITLKEKLNKLKSEIVTNETDEKTISTVDNLDKEEDEKELIK